MLVKVKKKNAFKKWCWNVKFGWRNEIILVKLSARMVE